MQADAAATASNRLAEGERDRIEATDEAVELAGPRVEGVSGRRRGVVVVVSSAAANRSGVLCDMAEVRKVLLEEIPWIGICWYVVRPREGGSIMVVLSASSRRTPRQRKGPGGRAEMCN